MNFPTKLTNTILLMLLMAASAQAQDKKDIKYKLNDDGSHFIQFTLLNQTWLRFNQSNPGTTVEGEAMDNTFDIGLRRTRFQLIGKLTDRVFFYSQLGMNNFNAQFNSTGGNRKLGFFVHDALCEYQVSQKANALKLGGGLTIANGLSRFSQPSIGTIMTMDVPVFAQATVDQTDEFSRKLSVYARGQIGHFDYRFSLTDPFPVTSAGITLPAIASNANFSQLNHRKQLQGYVAYQFFEHEPHTTPFMPGTYLGSKKVFNIAAGFIHQDKAMWRLSSPTDTAFQAMDLFAVESFLDMPLNKENGSAISAYVGYFNLNYGTNYLRYNGIMNPANGLSAKYTDGIKGQGPTFGNAFPMFGTGQTVYAQVGYLLPSQNKTGLRIMPYASTTYSKFDRLDGENCVVANVGINFLLDSHRAKLTLDWQNRPTFTEVNNEIATGSRKNAVTLQYQISF